MKKLSFLRTVAHLAALAILLFSGATYADAQTGRPPMLNIRFSIICLDNDVMDARIGTPDKSTPIVIPTGYKPGPVSYSGPAPMRIFRTPKTAGEAPDVLASITPPALQGDFLVVLKRIGDIRTVPERYNAMVIADDLSPAANNKWRLINLSNNKIAVVFVEADTNNIFMQEAIEPGKSLLRDMGQKTAHYDGKAYQLVTIDGKPAWKLGYSTRYFYAKGQSKLFIYFQPSGSPDRLQLKAMLAAKIRSEEPTGTGARRTTGSGRTTTGRTTPPRR